MTIIKLMFLSSCLDYTINNTIHDHLKGFDPCRFVIMWLAVDDLYCVSYITTYVVDA